ncbi:hypothetical protein CDAR_369991 [Caerostris darwini]|uniref:PRA1 family protein n=1 Tax=Caerostris darwini TaxID=1538125 RepID=A0AAV4N471_9ARAC|nr:hypothetical protein CDAR_369991 [Caerostris darwini]
MGVISVMYYFISQRRCYVVKGKTIKRKYCLVVLVFLFIFLSYIAGVRMVVIYTTEASFLFVSVHAAFYDQDIINKNKEESGGTKPNEIWDANPTEKELGLV